MSLNVRGVHDSLHCLQPLACHAFLHQSGVYLCKVLVVCFRCCAVRPVGQYNTMYSWSALPFTLYVLAILPFVLRRKSFIPCISVRLYSLVTRNTLLFLKIIPITNIYMDTIYKSMDNILVPCKLCRDECISIGSGYCKNCLMSVILSTQRDIYPISIKDLEKRWKKT